MSSSSHGRRQRRPLPVIDLAQLLGPDFRQRFTPVGRLNQDVEPEPNQPQQQDKEESNEVRMSENYSNEAPESHDNNINNTGNLKPAAKSKNNMSETCNRGRNQDTQRRGGDDTSVGKDESVTSTGTANLEKKRQSSADTMVASKPKKQKASTETSAAVQSQVFTKASDIAS